MKKTKLIALLLVIAAVFALSISVSASEPVEVADPDLAFTAEAPSVVSAGGTVTVNVNIPVNKGFTWAQATITYDADVLTYVEDKDAPNYSTEGTKFPSVVKVATKSGNRIVISVGTIPGFSDTVYKQTGFVVAVTFKVAEGFEDVTAVNLSYNPNNVVDADGKPGTMTVSVVGCSFNVVDWATHEHTPVDDWKYDTESHWHECAYCGEKLDKAEHVLSEDGVCECGYKTEQTVDFVYGDANGDGKVNSADIILIKKYIANFDGTTSSVEVFPGADANGDGSINSLDVILLKKYIANVGPDGNSSVVLGPSKEA